jgi:SH3 domain
MHELSAGKKVVQGLYDYAAADGEESSDLSFSKGDVMIVIKQLVSINFLQYLCVYAE